MPRVHQLLPLGAAVSLVFLVWAGVYLPGLGNTELKSEEPRRALPAIQMLETGNWLQPFIGARPYLRKPPFNNWAIAGSVMIQGGRWDEFSVRLPSVLGVLALAVTVVLVGSRWLGAHGAVLSAIFVLTNISMMEKGRLAEIEALYIALFGIALTFWITGWIRGSNPWAYWLPTGLFLGLGMLSKGPPHLVFFAAIVLGVLFRQRDQWKRLLLHPAPYMAAILLAGIFLAWAIPFAQANAASGLTDSGDGGPSGAAGEWMDQLVSRLGLSDFKFTSWVQNVPRGILNLLPWCVFFPLLWHRPLLEKLSSEAERRVIMGARDGVFWSFLIISLLPSSIERYTLPLLTPVFLLNARLLTVAWADRREMLSWLWSAWRTGNLAGAMVIALGLAATVVLGLNGWRIDLHPSNWLLAVPAMVALGFILLTPDRLEVWLGLLSRPLATACICVVITAIFAMTAIPKMREHDDLVPFAAQVKSGVEAGHRLYLLDLGFRQWWFYLEPEADYFRKLSDVEAREDGLASVNLLLPRKKLIEWEKEALFEGYEVRERAVVPDPDRMADKDEAWVLIALKPQ